MLVAASVYDGKFQTWRQTGNALEGTAESRNDGLLTLDEIKEAGS